MSRRARDAPPAADPAAPRPSARPSGPGPGPIPPTVLRSLDLAVLRRVESLVPGEHLTPQVGGGTELALIRPYRPGDDVRHIDWNVTARMREPHVRVHVGERAMTAWLLLDVSASMTFGTADRRKADVAEGVALAIGHVATRRGNRLGVVALGGGEPRILRPRQGRLGLLGLLAELRAEPEADLAGATSLGSAARKTAALARNRGLIVVVSDFRGEQDWEGPLRTLRAPPRRARGRGPRPARDGAPAGRRPVAHRSRRRGGSCTSTRTAARVRKRFAKAAAEEREEVAAALRRDRRRAPRAVDRGGLAADAGRAPAAERAAVREAGTRHELPRAVGAGRSVVAAAGGDGLRGHAAAQARRRGALRQPRAAARARHRAAGLAPAPAAAAPARRARRARGRARAAAAHGRRAAAPGDGDDGHRRLGLDAGQRRRARPALGRRRGRPRAGRQAARTSCGSGSCRSPTTPSRPSRRPPSAGRSTTRSTGSSPTAAPRWATRCAAASSRCGRRSPTATAAARAGCPGVIVLLSDGKNTSGNTRPLDVARQAKALHIPIYAIALGTPSGRIELTDPFSGATQTIAVPPDPETLKADRDDHRRALLRDREGRRPQVDLREPRHAALLQAGEARGDGRVRRRRARAAAARRRPQPRVVRPPAIAVSTSRSASPESPTASTTPTPRA